MHHYGDITKINGHEVPIVDIVTGGSPCQDLSVAGKRAGLDGERSGLFMEQIRVIKEMRDECARQLRLRGADEPIRPRYMVWENVPGAFSSNKGEDFRCVLEETAKIADENAVIPRLEGKWSQSGLILGDGYSIAWRLHDLQYFGCPQRRKRICLLADFNGHSAGKILFELRRETSDGNTEQTITDIRNKSESQVSTVSESLPGNTEQGEQERKEVAGDIGTGIAESNNSYTLKIRGGCERDSSGKSAGKGALIQTEKSGTLGVSQDQTLISFGVTTKGNGDAFLNQETHTSLSIGGGQAGQGYPCVMEKCLNPWDVQSKHIQPTDGKAEALYSGECRYGGGESYVLSVDEKMGQTYIGEDIGNTLASRDYKQPQAVCTYQDTTGTLSPGAHAGSYNGQDAYNDMLVVDRPSEPILLESNQNHATVQTDGISTALPASMGMGGGYVPMVTYGLDRASFNQGKNAQFDFKVEKETAQTLVSRGPGGGTSETVGSLCARDYKGVGSQYVNEGKVIVQDNVHW